MARRSNKEERPATPEAGAPAEGLPPEVAAMPFEEALTHLEHIVDELEEGALPLEEALSRFERGIQLSRHLDRQLREAEARVQRLVGDAAAPALLPVRDAEDDLGGVGGGPESGAGPGIEGGPREPGDGESDGGDRLF